MGFKGISKKVKGTIWQGETVVCERFTQTLGAAKFPWTQESEWIEHKNHTNYLEKWLLTETFYINYYGIKEFCWTGKNVPVQSQQKNPDLAEVK